LNAHLERVYDTAPNIGVGIMLGCTVAKFGQETGYYTIIWKHSLHKHLIRMGTLIYIAQRKNMMIRQTKFPRQDIHKATWISPAGQTTN